MSDKNVNYCCNDFCTPCFCVTENSTILLCSFSDRLWLEILALFPLSLTPVIPEAAHIPPVLFQAPTHLINSNYSGAWSSDFFLSFPCHQLFLVLHTSNCYNNVLVILLFSIRAFISFKPAPFSCSVFFWVTASQV